MNPTPPLAATPRLADPQGSRAKIVEVAEALFARSGFAGVGLREVADRAGMGKSSLFHHFPSKMHLYLEVLRNVLERIAARLHPALERSEPAAEKLEAWLEALVDALAEHPTTARLLLRALFEDDDVAAELTGEAESVERTLMSILAGFRRLVAQGIEQGAFRAVSVSDATQSMIGAAVYHFASGEIGEAVTGGPIFSADAVHRRKREFVAFVMNGLGTH
jgi:AcrR family transcriptional regulator